MSDLNNLQSRLSAANSVLVVLPKDAGQDVVAAGLAVYLSLQNAGKTTSIVSDSQPVVRDSHLVGLDQIETSVGGQNLVITINLPEDAVDKVTSNVEGGHLNLILQPKPGATPIKREHLTFGTSGAAADLVLVIGTSSLAEVGPLADKEYELFAGDNLVNLSNKPGQFGSINLTDPSASCSELVTAILQELKLPLNPDIASNLMQGIEDYTQHLSSFNMTADTFEALAVLYRAGARRQPQSDAPQAQVINNTPIIDPVSQTAASKDQAPSVNPQSKQAPSNPVPEPSSADKSGKADWLKPKIFKGGNPSTK